MPGHAHAAAPNLATTIAGPYKGLWNDYDMGNTLDGFRLVQRETGRLITADILGEAMIDQIYSGGSYMVNFVAENFNAEAIEHMIWWHGNSVPANYEWGLSDGVGQSMWEAAKPLILHACHAVDFASVDTAGNTVITPSTGASASNPYIDPLDIVFPKTLLRPGEDVTIEMAYKERFIPIVLDIYPVSNQFDGAAWDPAEPDKVERPSECDKVRWWYATRGTGPQPPAP